MSAEGRLSDPEALLAAHEQLWGTSQVTRWYAYCRCSQWSYEALSAAEVNHSYLSHVAAALDAHYAQREQAARAEELEAAAEALRGERQAQARATTSLQPWTDAYRFLRDRATSLRGEQP